MPQLDDDLKEDLLPKILCYGPEKTKKTWWAGTAAEAGFNVLLLNGDKGHGILKNLTPEARKRIYTIACYDADGQPVFAEFMSSFIKGTSVIWDEKQRKCLLRPNENSIQVRKRDLNKNRVVVVLDSFSALVHSLVTRYCKENQIDLSEAAKQEWEGYRWCGQMLDYYIQGLKELNCIVVVIGHMSVYEKAKLVGKTRVVEWTRTMMKSSSGPHGLTIAKDFDEVLYFTMRASNVYIDVRPDAARAGGGRIIPPQEYAWKDLPFEKVVELIGIEKPPEDLPSLVDAFKNQTIPEPKPQPTTTVPTGGIKASHGLKKPPIFKTKQ